MSTGRRLLARLSLELLILTQIEPVRKGAGFTPVPFSCIGRYTHEKRSISDLFFSELRRKRRRLGDGVSTAMFIQMNERSYGDDIRGLPAL